MTCCGRLADVLIGLFSIPFQFQAALLQRWDLPNLLCPIAPFVKELTVTVSILTLAVISIDRYRAVVHPLTARWSTRLALTFMFTVWTMAAVSSAPTATAYSVVMVPDEVLMGRSKKFCMPDWPSWGEKDVGKFYRLYLAIVQYFLPLVVIIFCYCCIICRIWLTRAPGVVELQRNSTRDKNKRKVGTAIPLAVLRNSISQSNSTLDGVVKWML